MEELIHCSDEELERLIYAIEHRIALWVETHNKQYWDVVRFVCERRGWLGKYQKDGSGRFKLTRQAFAAFLLHYCPNAFPTEETDGKLKSSMEHFPISFDNYDNLHKGHYAKCFVEEVESLLDHAESTAKSTAEVKSPTVSDRLLEYLQRDIDTGEGQFPCSVIDVDPRWLKISPAPSIAICTYSSASFIEMGKPSFIIVYEIIEGLVGVEDVHSISGKYLSKRMPVKIFIASTKGLMPNVKNLMEEREIGFVLVNPKRELTSDAYKLPRYIGAAEMRQGDYDALMGRKPLEKPLLIMDAGGLTHSLADTLRFYKVAVKESSPLLVPFMSAEAIEHIADQLTAGEVSQMFSKLATSNYATDVSINVYQFIQQQGIGLVEQSMPFPFQLGQYEVIGKRIVVNTSLQSNIGRERFTLAHELGHHMLHRPLFLQQGVVSAGSTEQVLSAHNTIIESNQRRLEYQANKFASCLLMPRKLVEARYRHYYTTYLIGLYGGNLRPLYYSPKQPETFAGYNIIVRSMAREMRVSIKAMAIRLQELGLLKIGD